MQTSEKWVLFLQGVTCQANSHLIWRIECFNVFSYLIYSSCDILCTLWGRCMFCFLVFLSFLTRCWLLDWIHQCMHKNFFSGCQKTRKARHVHSWLSLWSPRMFHCHWRLCIHLHHTFYSVCLHLHEVRFSRNCSLWIHL